MTRRTDRSRKAKAHLTPILQQKLPMSLPQLLDDRPLRPIPAECRTLASIESHVMANSEVVQEEIDACGSDSDSEGYVRCDFGESLPKVFLVIGSNDHWYAAAPTLASAKAVMAEALTTGALQTDDPAASVRIYQGRLVYQEGIEDSF